MVLLDQGGNLDPSLDLGSGFLSGLIDNGTHTLSKSYVSAVALQSEKIIVAGNFSLLGGEPVSRIVRIAPRTVVGGPPVPPVLHYSHGGPLSSIQFELYWESKPEFTYVVEYSTDSTTWQSLSDPLAGADGTMTYRVSSAMTDRSQVFYRLRVIWD